MTAMSFNCHRRVIRAFLPSRTAHFLRKLTNQSLGPELEPAGVTLLFRAGDSR